MKINCILDSSPLHSFFPTFWKRWYLVTRTPIKLLCMLKILVSRKIVAASKNVIIILWWYKRTVKMPPQWMFELYHHPPLLLHRDGVVVGIQMGQFARSYRKKRNTIPNTMKQQSDVYRVIKIKIHLLRLRHWLNEIYRRFENSHSIFNFWATISYG